MVVENGFKLNTRLIIATFALALSFPTLPLALTFMNHLFSSNGGSLIISFLTNFILVFLFYEIISNTKWMTTNGYTLPFRSFIAICVLVFSFSAIFHTFSILRYILVCYILISCFYAININKIDSNVIDSNGYKRDFKLHIRSYLIRFVLFITLLISSYTIAAYSVAMNVMENNGYLLWPWSPPGIFYPWPYSHCSSGHVCFMMVTRSKNQADLFIFKYFIETGFLVILTGILWVIVGSIISKKDVLAVDSNLLSLSYN